MNYAAYITLIETNPGTALFRQIGEVEYPAVADNCFFYHVAMWNAETGFREITNVKLDDGRIAIALPRNEENEKLVDKHQSKYGFIRIFVEPSDIVEGLGKTYKRAPIFSPELEGPDEPDSRGDHAGNILEDEDTRNADGSQRVGPIPGTFAFTAALMHSIDPSFDWDQWKDEMKDASLA